MAQGGEHLRVDAKRWKGILSSGHFNGAQLSGAYVLHAGLRRTGCVCPSEQRQHDHASAESVGWLFRRWFATHEIIGEIHAVAVQNS